MKLSDLLSAQDKQMEALLIKRNADIEKIKKIDEADPNNLRNYDELFNRTNKEYDKQITDLKAFHKAQIDHYFPPTDRKQNADMDSAYNKTVNVNINDVKKETKEERVARKLALWQEEQKLLTKKHGKT
jgi:hypothetical protein